MEIFKSDVLNLVVGLIVIGFFLTSRHLMKSLLSSLAGSSGIKDRDILPVRRGDIKETEAKPVGRVRYWLGELASNYKIYGEIFRRIPRREVLLTTAADLMLMAALSVGMAMFCTYTDGGSDLYMTTFMTLMYVITALILFARCVDGSRAVYLPCCLLILTGVALAVLLYLSCMAEIPENYIGHPNASVTFHVLALILSLAIFPLIRMVCRAERRNEVLVILNLLLIATYAVLMIFGEEVHGVRNWLKIGSFQFQVSEVTKVLTLAILGLTLTNEQMSEKKRFWWSVFTMVINGACLLLASEFGTLMVLCAVFVGMCMFYVKDLRALVALIIVAVILLSIGLMVARFCYMLNNPEETTPPTDASVQTTAAAEDTTAPTESVPDSTSESGEAAASKETITKKIGGYYKKFRDRFLVFLMPDEVDLQKEGYQWMKSREALVIADWGGSPYDIAIPVARSDFIYSYLIVRMGMLYGFCALVLLVVMMYAGIVRSLRNPMTGEAAVSVSFLLSIVIQALIAAASSTGHFAIVGIPFAFLAYGGSATMMNYTMLVFLIYATRSKPLVLAKGTRRSIISRKED